MKKHQMAPTGLKEENVACAPKFQSSETEISSSSENLCLHIYKNVDFVTISV